jgi:hypothetical protein
MITLPYSADLPTAKLAASFGNTSATYKFYWLLSIIEMAEQGETHLKKRALFSRMIANAWYTVNYFHVSFGKQDLIQTAVVTILKAEKLTIDIKKNELLTILEHSENTSTKQALWHFNKNVPHWFLSPWFARIAGANDTHYRNAIYTDSQHFENDCLYALYDDSIVINPNWMHYLKQNARMLKDFCYWNLALFLQTRNPNVPDIPNKLIKPALRSTLTNQRANYWNIVFKELGAVECIFTNNKLQVESFALDHFVPHAFVSHDLIWNLLPIDKTFNAIKSDKLPSIDKHFDKFFNLQKTAYEIITHHNAKSKLLEEYLTIFPVLDNVDDFEYLRYKESIQPLVTIAHNNGFGYLTV